MNISIKRRIYLSFSLLVCLFVLNGIFTNITLNKNNKLSARLSEVIDPSLQALDDFKKILLESKMYTTNWVFLRSNQEDKKLLEKLHNSDYGTLKSRFNVYSSQWANKSWVDSLNRVYAKFEELLAIEKNIMGSLQRFADYDDPVIKLEAERKVEEEILPRTTALMNSLNAIYSQGLTMRAQENDKLERSSMKLRGFIIVLAITIICIGLLLSMYMTKVIIRPVNRIRYIINNLGKGIIQKIDQKANADEIGKMVHSVNNLSEKLQATATFAHEVGIRNFDMPFKPLSDEDTLGKALIAMRDNLKTSEQELIDANTEIQTIFNAALDAVVIIDEEGKIVKWDYKAETLFGWKEEEVMGMSLSDTIIPLRYREAHQRGMKHFLKTGEGAILGKTIEVHALKKNNDEIDISLSVSPSVIKDNYRFIGFIRDITSRKKAEADIQQSKINLAVQNKELEQKNKELEQFAYVASHDLQEPLRTTSSFVELFQQQYQGKLDEKADKYLTYIAQASERMKVFITDLLEYSRIGSKKELQQVDCNILVNEVLADLDTAIHETGAKIKTNPLPVISGYQTEIKQLIQNLVFNAIKFRQKNVSPKIKISAHREGDSWQFAFADNGIGIAKEHYERIFIIFQRLHNRNEYSGSGIGLSHCKKIVELHKGKIWLKSEFGKGTTFYFTIPQKNNN